MIIANNDYGSVYMTLNPTPPTNWPFPPWGMGMGGMGIHMLQLLLYVYIFILKKAQCPQQTPTKCTQQWISLTLSASSIHSGDI